MPLSDRQLLDALSRMPFVESTELALILGEPRATVHRRLSELLAELPTTRGIWSTELTTDKEGRRRHVGHRIETWARQTKHAGGITWFLSKLQAEARTDPDSELVWSVPTARSDRAYNWGRSAIAHAGRNRECRP